MAHRVAVIAGQVFLAGMLLGVPASSVSAHVQDGAGGGRSNKRHAAVAAASVDTVSAADPAAVAARWGIAIEAMRLASGGYMLEFRYRILDAAKAQPLFTRGLRPMLLDEASGFRSVVPNPPTTGSLRSTNDAKAGRTYFMFFANPSHFVKPGNAVTVTIGNCVLTGIKVIDDSSPAAVAQ